MNTRFYKIENSGYIDMIGTGGGGVEITEPRYNEILSVVQSKPKDTETIGYRLKTDLTWEQYEKEPMSEPDPTPEEALSILLGGAE